MLNYLIRFSLSHRGLILLASTLIMVFGLLKARELPIDVLPDLTRPTVTLITEVPGYATEEVEALVTIPLENALMGVNGVTRLRTINDVSLSVVIIEFDWGTDIYRARQFVQERLTGMGSELPAEVTPYMTPVASLMGDILMVGVRDTSGQLSPREIRTMADWDIARQIQSIPGVAEVLTMGGGIQQIHILPDPHRMQTYGVTFEELREAAAGAVRNSNGGFLTESSREIMVRNLAMTTDPQEIGSTVVSKKNDRAIQIGDVAEVTLGVKPMRGDAGLGVSSGENSTGGPGVIINIRKSPGFDTIALSHEVENALDALADSLPEGVELVTLYRQADFINLSIGNLTEALRDGAVMVAIILFLFLMNVRVTLITLTAIPLSLAIALFVFDVMGITVNAMTLGGFAVAIGMVVDDAIIDVENVYRRLKENAASTKPLATLEIIARASAEVRSSILFATILIVLVFLPLMALSGVEGKLFTPIAIATIVSMTASFIVSLTVIPVLSSFLLKPKSQEPSYDRGFVQIIKDFGARTWLRLSINQPVAVYGLVAGLLFLSCYFIGGMGGAFLPPFREPTALVAMTTAPGTSLKTTTELSQTAQDLLLKIPGVKTVGFRVGRAEHSDHVVPISSVEFDVEFDESSGRLHDDVLADIRNTLKTIPGTFSTISGPLADRIGHMLSGVSAKVAVKVFGPDLDELRRIGNEVAFIAREIPGMEEARVEQQAQIPQLRIEVDRQRAAAYGITPGKLNDELSSLMGGETVGQVFEGVRTYDLVVRLPEEWRENPEKLKHVFMDTEGDGAIPLHYVADIRQASGPNAIKRENTRRRFVVSINPTTDDLSSVVEELQTRLSQSIALPDGYTIQYEGEYQAREEARRVILLMSCGILLVITMLLYSYFQSMKLVFVVLLNIPIALIGAVLYTRLTLNNISIATLVGFIAVTGIAARNSIMMLSHYLHLIRHENEGFTKKMVERGTLERLIPVLMTALSAGLALVPMVMHGDEPGKEILNPVAIVIIGGLISSTMLGLCLTPAVFFQFCKNAALTAVDRKAPASN